MHSAPVPINFRCCSNSDTIVQRIEVTLGANNKLLHRNKQRRHSITSSARASSVGGTVTPSALAVLRLITSSYLVRA